MNIRDIIILCCNCAIFTAFVIVLRQRYFGHPSQTEEESKRLRLRGYILLAILLMAYAVMVVARYSKVG
jgi:hypothetical protein